VRVATIAFRPPYAVKREAIYNLAKEEEEEEEGTKKTNRKHEKKNAHTLTLKNEMKL
jgi:hypothetical protein